MDRIDYADRYAVDLPAPMDAPAFCAAVLESAPRWLERTLSARDAVAGRLGFHTQRRNYGERVEPAPGARFGPLTVRTVSPEAVVCADTDSHLAVRATFAVAGSRGTFTTEVQFLDAVGRAYFTVVRPFHRRVVPALVSGPFAGRARPEPL